MAIDFYLTFFFSNIQRYFLLTFQNIFFVCLKTMFGYPIRFFLDDVLQYSIDPGNSFWDYGGFDAVGDIDNIWDTGRKMTPFDERVIY